MKFSLHQTYFVLFFITALKWQKAECNTFETKQTSKSKLTFSLSPLYFARLAARESRIYELLKSYNLASKQPLVTTYLTDYEETLKYQEGKVSWDVTHHPLLIFRMVWRFVFQIPPLIAEFSASKDKMKVELVQKINASDTLGPIALDEILTQTTVGLLNIHHVFDFPAAEMARGKFGEVETGVKLTPSQMLEIAYIANVWEYFVQAKDWLDSVELVATENNDLEDLKLLQEELAESHDRVFTNKSNGGSLHIFSQPLSSGHSEPAKIRELRDWLEYSDGSGLQRERMIKVFGLCSNSSLFKVKGRRVRSPRSLKCWNDFRKHPVFRISPLKTELLSSNPKIYLFHDFLLESNVKTLESLSIPHLMKDAEKPQRKVGELLGVITVEKEILPPQLNLVKKLEQILGLNVAGNASEKMLFTLTNFGDDGRGFVSHDAYIASRLNGTELFADRMSTIKIFISDVVLGGEIVFPDLDLVIKPVQGALLYCGNYHKDGKVDWRSYHGSCPTILGHKLIASLFIRGEHNMWSRPCGRRPSEDFHWHRIGI